MSMTRPSLAALGKLFRPCDGAATRKSPSWRELMDLHRPWEQPDPTWGEARTAEQMERLPRGVHLRGALLDDGTGMALRWVIADSLEAANVLGTYFHADLERGEAGGEAQCGWIKLDSAGALEAQQWADSDSSS